MRRGGFPHANTSCPHGACIFAVSGSEMEGRPLPARPAVTSPDPPSTNPLGHGLEDRLRRFQPQGGTSNYTPNPIGPSFVA